ncbi:MAG: helix-turn-helix transcriptional regulator [Myxococcaceae bacterium]
MSTKEKGLIDLLEADLGPISFSGFLRGARASQDLSQAEMALMLGITRSTLCDIEKGRHFVSPALASKIAKTCGLSEKMAVLAAIQDQLNRAHIDMRVALEA